MKEFRDIMVIVALAAIPISGFLSTAFLIVSQQAGLGLVVICCFHHFSIN